MLLLSSLGRAVSGFLNGIGAPVAFLSHAVRVPRFKLFMEQAASVGVDSLPIVLLTTFFTGGVLALQGYHAFSFSSLASSQLGPLVGLSLVRELAPVLAGLMLAGRVGASMAAELGTMKTREQLDALFTMGISPQSHLVAPRIWAAVVMSPLLLVAGVLSGIFGSYVVATYLLDVNPHLYLTSLFTRLEGSDLFLGLVKSAVFGLLVGWLACYQGFQTKGGAAGVGQSTTRAVVHISVAILVADYFLTALFMNETGGF